MVLRAKQVDFAGLQSAGKRVHTGGRRELNFFGVAEDGRSHGAAEVDVEAVPAASVIGEGEAGKTGGHAALQMPFGLHVVEGRRTSGTGGEQRAERYRRHHSFLFHPFISQSS